MLATIAVLHGTVLALLAAYGVHRLVLLSWLRRAVVPVQTPREGRVTVQLPVYNERFVVERLLRSAAALDWEDLEIQVLDDSSDETRTITARVVLELQNQGIEIVHLHRSERSGFKAGALEAGLRTATGEFIAIFDADFLPQADFLRRAMPHFSDGVGMVQARWGHLNRDESWLTRLQAVLLDGHFVVEHAARHAARRWFNFNGTAGIWRREAIQDAGGWQHDTLTEDLDLSYRAQHLGWRFVFLPDLVVPAELPSSTDAFLAQQHRWAKGSIQTALKLLPRLLRSSAPAALKLEATAHLLANLAYPLVLLLSLLTPLVGSARESLGASWLAGLDVAVFVLATASVAAFYGFSQWTQGRSAWAVPLTMALGIGMAWRQSVAVLEALLGRPSPFVRTPKAASSKGAYSAQARHRLGEVALFCWQALGIGLSLADGSWSSLPLQLLFLVGFGLLLRPVPRPVPQPVADPVATRGTLHDFAPRTSTSRCSPGPAAARGAPRRPAP